MAEAGNDGQGAAAGSQPNLSIVMQYVKDLSFENPGAPASFGQRQSSPNISITIGVQARPIGGDDTEVELKIEARAVDGETNLFVIELAYAGLFRLTNIPPQDVSPITLIECPRLLFPFARQIVAEASRNGGFPPLLIDPVDFMSLYRQRLAQAGAEPAPPSAPPTAPSA